MEPRQHRDGSAPTFEQARRKFLFIWRQILPTIDGAAFEAYRRSRAFHKWKYRMWNEGVKMPTQLASGKSKCFCGAEIDLTNTEDHIYSAHMDLK